ncbi:hypothetical protein B0H13DRAFT_2020192 [Mycena leptocephala]|nr:hypothetical protein B0H13DRAFT_2020192 [Mycena leptocephala]
MVLAHEDEEESSAHPYWYGRINTTKIHRMEFLWVRCHAGCPLCDTAAFGFLDPAEVIRAAHLIPAFHYGRNTELLAPSIARHFDAENNEDYRYYYVNHFVDRDTFMRYIGNAVGHRTTTTSVSADPVDASLSDDEMEVDPPIQPEPEIVDEVPEIDEEIPADPELESDCDSDESSQEEEQENDEEDPVEGAEPTDEDFLEAEGFDDL